MNERRVLLATAAVRDTQARHTSRRACPPGPREPVRSRDHMRREYKNAQHTVHCERPAVRLYKQTTCTCTRLTHSQHCALQDSRQPVSRGKTMPRYPNEIVRSSSMQRWPTCGSRRVRLPEQRAYPSLSPYRVMQLRVEGLEASPATLGDRAWATLTNPPPSAHACRPHRLSSWRRIPSCPHCSAPR